MESNIISTNETNDRLFRENATLTNALEIPKLTLPKGGGGSKRD